MRILILAASYPPVLGGLQTITQSLAKTLSQAGHEVLVVAQRYPRSLPAQENREGVEVRRMLFLAPRLDYVLRGRLDLWIAAFYFFPGTFWRLYRLMDRFRPDVVNIHFPDAQIPFLLGLRRFFKFRLVASLHGDEILRYTQHGVREGRTYLLSLLREADRVTACSRYLLTQAMQLDPGITQKGHAIHNGIDPDLFQDRAKHISSRPYIFAFGRLTRAKGFDLLLQAFERSAHIRPDLDLIIAGAGEEGFRLRELAQELGIPTRVLFYGPASIQQIVGLLNGCEFVVMPSREEPFGIAALEAMAAGKFVLASKVGGLPEFLADSPNRLVEPTLDSLSAGLRGCFHRIDELKILGEENRGRAADYYCHRMTEKYLGVFGGKT